MYLPKNVLSCIAALEKAGFEAYAVGGCVRDAILGLTPHDYDLCTNALPEETAGLFPGHTLVRSGEKHGTIGVVFDKEVIEITTFRTEGGYQDSRHPGWVRFVPDVKEDLSRRDFTVNAMAYNPKTGYIDPFGGQEDLQKGILRAVGDPTTRFTEDALRILRGVRFGVRFSLTPTEDTLAAMNALAPLMDNLARERVFDELCKLLPLLKSEDMATYSAILTQVIPPLAPTLGFDQKNPHHIYDVYTHTAQVVENAPKDLAVRWAAILHDCGKPGCFSLDETGIGHFYGHAEVSAQMADDLLLQLKAPTALRERVVFLIEKHMTPLEPDKKLLRRRLGQYGVDALHQLVALQKADCIGTGTHENDRFEAISALIAEILQEQACLTLRDLAVNGKDLQKIGFAPGKEIGACLNLLLEQVLDEKLPNEKEVLLSAAKHQL
ncbi:MAG: HD domain-containing protein [Oscillospiraceae bacterium]|nr:HD domain-containing protein [Oscillospiraceae bacterium]